VRLRDQRTFNNITIESFVKTSQKIIKEKSLELW